MKWKYQIVQYQQLAKSLSYLPLFLRKKTPDNFKSETFKKQVLKNIGCNQLWKLVVNCNLNHFVF